MSATDSRVIVPGVGIVDSADLIEIQNVALPLYSEGRRTIGALIATAHALYAGFGEMSAETGSILLAEAGRALDYVEQHNA